MSGSRHNSGNINHTKMYLRIMTELPQALDMVWAWPECSLVHFIWQVETVGDAYMVVSGAPVPHRLHALMMCDMALDMIDAIQSVPNPATEDDHIQVKIGDVAFWSQNNISMFVCARFSFRLPITALLLTSQNKPSYIRTSIAFQIKPIKLTLMVLVVARTTFPARTNFFFNIKNPVWVVEFLVFKDPVALIVGGKWKGREAWALYSTNHVYLHRFSRLWFCVCV